MEQIISYVVANGILLALLGGAGYLARDSFVALVTARVGGNIQSKLQEQGNAFQRELSELEANLSAHQLHQEKLLSTLLNTNAERSRALIQKEMQAAEEIWAAVSSTNALLLAAQTAELIKTDQINTLTSSERDALAQVAAAYVKHMTPELIASTACDWARLYVSERCWLLFTAYRSVITRNAMIMKAISLNLDPSIIAGKQELKKVLIGALPHQESVINKYDDLKFTIFLEEISETLVKEIRLSLNEGTHSNHQAERARLISSTVKSGNT